MSVAAVKGGGVRLYIRFAALVAIMVACAAGISLIVGVSVGIGDMPIPLSSTYAAITNRLGWTSVDLNRIHETIIWITALAVLWLLSFAGQAWPSRARSCNRCCAIRWRSPTFSAYPQEPRQGRLP